MPVVRGQFYAELESTGRAKRFLDVLLWDGDWSRANVADLNDIEVHREYLRRLTPSDCGIRLWVPAVHMRTSESLTRHGIEFATVPISEATDENRGLLADDQLAFAVNTALACDADVIVTTNPGWFPFVSDLEGLGLLIADTGLLRRQCDVFSRGNDVPWSSEDRTFGLTGTVSITRSKNRRLALPCNF